MVRFPCFAVIVALSVVGCVAPGWAVCLSQLDREVERISRRSLVSTARLGVYAQNADQVLINRDGDRAFIPASNQKILTSAAALHYLSAEFRVATTLMTELPPENGEIKGNLWVIGRGDPTLTSAKGLRELVQLLRGRNIHTIRGEIKFLPALRAQPLSRGWEVQDLHEYYAAPTSAFTLDENSHYWTVTPTRRGQPVQFSWDFPELVTGWRIDNRAITSPPNGSYTLYTERIIEQGQKILRLGGTIPENEAPELGGVTIPDQMAYFRERLQAELQLQGIKVLGETVNLGTARHELANYLSPTLAEILPNINKESNNLHAELLLRILGNRLHEVEPDAYTAGIIMVRKFLGSLGQSIAGIVIADGSGLSRYNLVTPRLLVQILKAMSGHPDFRASLAIAGVDGTLKKRFRNTIATNNIRGKTGTLTGAVSLSGYLTNPNLGEIIFSIMINNTSQSTATSRRVIDEIALLLVQLKKC
jgi:D-alanyl-D-alanine carboxypeptidase, serine-type, PBP4 family